MTTLSFTAIAFLFGCLAIIVEHWLVRGLFRTQDAIIQKYKLFKVRDDLIYLVASRKIAEDDRVFRYFYESITFVIKRTDVLTLRSLLDALQAAKKNGLDPAGNEFVSQLNRDLENRTSEIREVIMEYYQAVLETLLENSWFLRLTIQNGRFRATLVALKRFLVFLATVIQPLPPFAAFALYQQYKNAANRTAQGSGLAAAA